MSHRTRPDTKPDTGTGHDRTLNRTPITPGRAVYRTPADGHRTPISEEGPPPYVVGADTWRPTERALDMAREEQRPISSEPGYHKRKMAELRAARRASGLCVICGGPKSVEQARCNSCREKTAARKRADYRRAREARDRRSFTSSGGTAQHKESG